MTTVHFIYPYGQAISTPDAIGRNVSEYLRRHGYLVRNYDFADEGVIEPGDDDILLGHPHPYPWTIFRRSYRRPGWKRIIIMSPYSHGDHYQVSFLDRMMPYVDQYLAI